MSEISGRLPEGVSVRELSVARDARGVFVEVFREEWQVGPRPLQWSLLHTNAGVMRGVKVHALHDDYQIVFSGRAMFGIADLRRGSRTEGAAAVVTIGVDGPGAITIPHGVAHGVYYAEATIQALGTSCYYDLADEIRVRWNDPMLAIPWPAISPRLSSEDADAPSAAEVRALLDGLLPAVENATRQGSCPTT
jgi:dTDP-4-dehydrorhamnose 3,5-epimerase